ncbi:hypothetical protein B0T10DRAFT_418516 [Thelonectria olida]|uniref:Uncharacterized protein n=1 Tax=Thelonectria olida TaxID=1576542 RepID=A0A9P8VS64_9HYPO|nr:hypothetical protein B0T10DRAFT_418516 [Thelonectria olida]
MTLETPVALITGCSSGIGKHLAQTFASRGVTVLATARRVESLQELTSQYENIEAFPLELNNLESMERLRDEITECTGGRLDFLVNNAGTHYAATAMDLDVEEAIKLFTVNVFSVMRLCQLFVPLLRKAPDGRIVQIGSVTRDVPVVWQGAYNASKAALSQYTKTLRLEVKPFGISVIEVVTGFVRSNILHHGLYAPDGSLYLPIKATIERIKYDGNANGMMADAYARSIVSKLLQGSTGPEIWEGKLAWYLRFIIACCPASLMNWIFFRYFQLYRLYGSRRVAH